VFAIKVSLDEMITRRIAAMVVFKGKGDGGNSLTLIFDHQGKSSLLFNLALAEKCLSWRSVVISFVTPAMRWWRAEMIFCGPSVTREQLQLSLLCDLRMRLFPINIRISLG
jgi:hypothetical protein